MQYRRNVLNITTVVFWHYFSSIYLNLISSKTGSILYVRTNLVPGYALISHMGFLWRWRFGDEQTRNHCLNPSLQFNDVIMSVMASQITSLAIVYSTDQRKHQSSASLAFVRGIHRWPVNSPHKGPCSNAENVSIWWRHHDSYDRRFATWPGSCFTNRDYVNQR